ncbi:hypothetical protein JHK86_034266 [Glycine max]|nr:hypothetical protein JHK86_034266 [Glycine max]
MNTNSNGNWCELQLQLEHELERELVRTPTPTRTPTRTGMADELMFPREATDYFCQNAHRMIPSSKEHWWILGWSSIIWNRRRACRSNKRKYLNEVVRVVQSRSGVATG